MDTKDPGEAATSRGVTNLRMSEIDMGKPTCSEAECDKATLSRGLCVTHYHRWNRATKDQRPAAGTCEGCGATLRALKKFCGPECRPRCSVQECEKPTHSKGMCSAHATRATRHGDPLAPLLRQSNASRSKRNRAERVPPKPCEVEGCDRPSRKCGWCAGHYQQWYKYGEVRPFKFTWSNEPNCVVCSRPNGQYRSRKFCSAACQQYFARHRGPVANPSCALCGVEIDLMVGTKQRSRIRVDVKLCRRCKSQTRTEATPGALALRDGPYCQLCGCDVDLSASAPDPMRASVDHIVPRAWGGSDAAENNQLTHLRCNQIKSDRYLEVSRRSLP